MRNSPRMLILIIWSYVREAQQRPQGTMITNQVSELVYQHMNDKGSIQKPFRLGVNFIIFKHTDHIVHKIRQDTCSSNRVACDSFSCSCIVNVACISDCFSTSRLMPAEASISCTAWTSSATDTLPC